MVKKLIYSLAFMLFAAIPTVAQEVDGDSVSHAPKKKMPNVIFGSVAKKITYQSVDGKKNPITLSATVYLPKSLLHHTVKRVLLSCHPTVTSSAEAPTGGTPVDGDIEKMTGEDGTTWMVVCPDYCGYGVSSYAQHPYLIHDVTARNCIDAVVYAIKNLTNWEAADIIPGTGKNYELASDYTTDIVGYSQGAATALACAKYLESDACPQDIKQIVNYNQTTCGDGPYSIRATLNQYVEWGKPQPNPEVEDDIYDRDLEYPCVLPLIVAAAKDAYQDGCMKTVEVEDFFNPEFLEKTGIMTMLHSKTTTTDDINSQVKRIWVEELGRRLRPLDILSDKLIYPNGTYNTETEQYMCLQRVMDWAELASGWNPQNKITFFHLKKDGVVPYSNYLAVKDGIHYKSTNGVIDRDEKGEPIQNPNVNLIEDAEKYSKDSGWLGFLANMNKAPEKDDIELLNHAEGGTLFYVIYMFYMDH